MINRIINLDSYNPDHAILPFIIIGAILFGGAILISAKVAIRDYLMKKALRASVLEKKKNAKNVGIFAKIFEKKKNAVKVGIFDNFNRLTSVETIECDTSDVSVGEVIYA